VDFGLNIFKQEYHAKTTRGSPVGQSEQNACFQKYTQTSPCTQEQFPKVSYVAIYGCR